MDGRDKMVRDVESAGRYIAANADNIVGRVPSGLVSLSIRCDVGWDSLPTVTVEREHVVGPDVRTWGVPARGAGEG